MTAILSPSPILRFVDGNGNALVSGQLFTYQAGTATPVATYTDSTGVTPNTNPVVLNARGECAVWLLPNVGYKFVLEDAAGNTIWTVDQIINSQLLTLYGGVDTGIANAYVLTFTASFTAYADGIIIYWIPSHTNTGPSTINVNGLGVVNIVNPNGSTLYVNELTTNVVSAIAFKGGQFILLQSAAPNVPALNVQNTNYTFGAGDSGNVVVHNDANFYAYTIPPNATVAFPVGGSIEVVNNSSNTLQISPGLGGVSLFPFAAGAPFSGSIVLQPGTATFITKVATDTWVQATQSSITYQALGFTGTLTSMTTTIQGVVFAQQQGSALTMTIHAALTGTSNDVFMTMTGLPAFAKPGATQSVPCLLQDNGVIKGGWANVATSGTITFHLGFDNATNFTNTGFKGLPAGWSITYSLG